MSASDAPTPNDRPEVVAVDVDGTLYDGRCIHHSAIDALQAARRAGLVVLIVSGRPWRDLPTIAPEVVDLAAGAVCEDGAVFVDFGRGTHHLFADALPDGIVDELIERGARDVVPGEIAIGMPADYLAIATDVAAAHPGRLRIERNKNSVALAPTGNDKGTGLERALTLMGLTGAHVLAIGDASNDLPMFRVADVAMAVANADDAVADAGIERAGAAFGEGVAEIVLAHLAARERAADDGQRSATEPAPSTTRTS